MEKQTKIDLDVLKELIKIIPEKDDAYKTGLEKDIDWKVYKEFVKDLIEISATNPSADRDKAVNATIRSMLCINTKESDTNSYPRSNDPQIQSLLDGLKETIFSISTGGMNLYKGGKWVATPNTVTIKVQDARAHNLCITVYGRPEEFEEINEPLNIQKDMNGYSRFILSNANALPSAINIIKQSYALKKARGRL